MNGSRLTCSSVMHVDSALVEDVFTENSRTGHILISYAVPGENDMIFIELLQLNVGWETILMNQLGESISLCLIRKGTLVNAEFSSVMTASIPPQTNAYRIIALIPERSTIMTTDRILEVDLENGFLYTGDPNNMADQIRFVINSSTTIQDQSGSPICLNALQSGQMVTVEHSSVQAPSIPPQTTAFRIQLA